MELLTPDLGLIFWTLFTLIVVFPVIALISLLKSTFRDSSTKLIWLIVILCVPVAGSILYFTIGRKQRLRSI